MKAILHHRLTQLALRWCLAAVFFAAGWLKLRDPLAFADSIDSFHLLPAHGITLLALGLPIFEMLIAALLALNRQTSVAAAGVMAMTAVFAFALGSAMLRQLPVDCGCFGGGEPAPWKPWAALGRDVLLFCGALIVHRHVVVEMGSQTEQAL